MEKLKNQYCYDVVGGNVKGAFNIYQGKSGFIYIVMGNRHTALTERQVNELGLDVYSLIDFDYEAYKKAYSTPATHSICIATIIFGGLLDSVRPFDTREEAEIFFKEQVEVDYEEFSSNTEKYEQHNYAGSTIEDFTLKLPSEASQGRVKSFMVNVKDDYVSDILVYRSHEEWSNCDPTDKSEFEDLEVDTLPKITLGIFESPTMTLDEAINLASMNSGIHMECLTAFEV